MSMGDFICLHSMSFNHSCITHGAIEWSDDDRIAVIHDQGIYILKLGSIMRDVTASFKVEVTLVPNILQAENFDIGIDPSIFCMPPTAFAKYNSFAYDRMLNHNKSLFNSKTSFSSAKWSPSGLSEDGRCVLATVTLHYHLDIHTSLEYIGKWKVEIDLSQQLYDDCKKDNFKKVMLNQFSSESSLSKKNYETFHIYKSRLYYLATVAICWCPCLVTKGNLPQDCAPTPPKKTKRNEAANIVTALLAATNKAGFIIIWEISNNLESNKLGAALLHVIGTGKEWGNSISWYQRSAIETGYLAVANVDGCIDVYVFSISDEGDKLNWQDIQTYRLWTEVDEILINTSEWILQEKQDEGKQLTLVVAKGTNILLFEFSIGQDGKIEKHSLLFGPCLHQAPITSLSTGANGSGGYVATSGLDGLVQCFQIGDLSAHIITTGCREGYTCNGLAVSRESLMIIALHSPFKLLLLQDKFIKQMDIVFVPMIPVSDASVKFQRSETRINSEYREFFRTSVSQGIQLDKSLQDLSKEPVSVDTSPHMLQKVAFLKWLTEFGVVRAEKEKVRQEGPSNKTSPVSMKNQEVQQIEKILWEKSMCNILTNAMQFVECGITLSQDDITTLLLASDWIVSEGNTQQGFLLALRSFEHLGHSKSIEAGNMVWEQRKCERDNNVMKGTSSPSTPSSKSSLIMDTTQPSALTCSAASVDNPDNNDKEPPKELTTVNGLLTFINQMPSRERCPICQNEVPFNRLDIGKCNKGHFFNRCSLTLQLCVDVSYRKCATCLKHSKTKLYVDNSVLNKHLLDIDFCPFCNGRITNPLT